jgi:D-serine dehydratase
MLDGIVTVQDSKLYDYMRGLQSEEDIFLEPSSCAGFHGVIKLMLSEEGQKFLKENALSEHMANASHIVWATGGGLVPDAVRKEMLETYL